MGDIKGEKGFTLIEVIITMGIFALVIMVSVNILLCAYKLQERSRHITTVNNEAAKKIEQQVGGTSGSIKIIFKDKDSGAIIFDETTDGEFYTGDAIDDTYCYFKPYRWNY